MLSVFFFWNIEYKLRGPIIPWIFFSSRDFVRLKLFNRNTQWRHSCRLTCTDSRKRTRILEHVMTRQYDFNLDLSFSMGFQLIVFRLSPEMFRKLVFVAIVHWTLRSQRPGWLWNRKEEHLLTLLILIATPIEKYRLVVEALWIILIRVRF